jgi:hypothetical protein
VVLNPRSGCWKWRAQAALNGEFDESQVVINSGYSGHVTFLKKITFNLITLCNNSDNM